ncbi:hypothetical protein Fmac_022891 [Flemingia macrophylla]|uniref:Uncharacterized protein n=1 Tax=Flemingia macrophylla TaxID=520843 RepID=A0ABD1LJY2_9FABA
MEREKKKQVLVEGLGARKKSLTEEDLDELKGCLDLGFGFNYDEIPELCNTLPALHLCHSNWIISSPGDHPQDVKARLKFWAQAVACTIKLCT